MQPSGDEGPKTKDVTLVGRPSSSVFRRAVRFGLRLLYNEFAAAYDHVAWFVSLGKWKAWGRTSIKYLCGRRVLELAHGPGHLLIALKQAGYQPTGIDVSPYMGKQAARRVRGLDIPLVRCRAQALPFRSGCFDSAVAAFPTNYIVDPLTVQEAARVTNREGRLVIVAGAQLAGRQPGARFIDGLYRITGQSDAVPDGRESIFQHAGMPARIEKEPVGASTVMLVIADKHQAA